MFWSDGGGVAPSKGTLNVGGVDILVRSMELSLFIDISITSFPRLRFMYRGVVLSSAPPDHMITSAELVCALTFS